jgi:hypothetical protein
MISNCSGKSWLPAQMKTIAGRKTRISNRKSARYWSMWRKTHVPVCLCRERRDESGGQRIGGQYHQQPVRWIGGSWGQCPQCTEGRARATDGWKAEAVTPVLSTADLGGARRGIWAQILQDATGKYASSIRTVVPHPNGRAERVVVVGKRAAVEVQKSCAQFPLEFIFFWSDFYRAW